MPAYITGKRTHKYTLEFKVKAVRWSRDPARSVKEAALALNIHPILLPRWCKEYREEKFGMSNSKKEAKPAGKFLEQDEIKRLKRRVAELEEEIDILKKWRRFQAEKRHKNTAS